ncbi:MAG: ribosomal protein S18-alanine N-acetyltransferase [Actinomycetota bacterium]|nr:ribosomal protein S18-alanine N-acetyltransferase [Actinomycetota bacterium]
MTAVASSHDFDVNHVELVPMRRRHVRQVMRIEAQVYPRPWSSALFLQEIVRRSDRVYLVAKWESTVVGYGGLITSGREAHITTIAVDPAYHRRHLGTKIMLGLMDAAIARGARTVSLEVRRSNFGAQNMYERFGFRAVGVRRGYYVETGEDAIVMWLDGADTPEYGRRLDRLRARVDGRAEGLDAEEEGTDG